MKETRSHEFSLLIDFWLFLGQSLSALKIFEQILQKCSLTDYSISLLVLITSTALSSLSFFRKAWQIREIKREEIRRYILFLSTVAFSAQLSY